MRLHPASGITNGCIGAEERELGAWVRSGFGLGSVLGSGLGLFWVQAWIHFRRRATRVGVGTTVSVLFRVSGGVFGYLVGCSGRADVRAELVFWMNVGVMWRAGSGLLQAWVRFGFGLGSILGSDLARA